MVVIDNAIDPVEYVRRNSRLVRSAWKIPDNHKVIIGVGRLVKQKNWDMFIKAARMVLQQNTLVTFIIAGEGPCRTHLTDTVNEWGMAMNVLICGHLKDVVPLYSMADIFVATSSWEGLPYTYLEAMYFKVSMLITCTEGIEYLTKYPLITCVPQNRAEILYEEIAKILSEQAKLEKKEADMQYPFLIDGFVERHQELYRRMASLNPLFIIIMPVCRKH